MKTRTPQPNLGPVPTRNDFLQDVVIQLVERRRALGLTQEHVDHIMGNSDRLCSKWECGTRTPTGFNLYCWATTLKCELKIKIKNEYKNYV